MSVSEFYLGKKILTKVLKYVQMYWKFSVLNGGKNQDVNVKYFDIIHPHFVKEERFPQSVWLGHWFLNTSAS